MATNRIVNEAVSVHLTNLAQMYIPPDTVYVADKLFPVIPGNPINFTYHTFESKFFGKKADNERASGADSDELTWDLSKSTGLTKEYARHMKIDRRDQELFGDTQLEISLTRALAAHMKIQREVRAATLLEATGTYPSSSHYTTLSGTSQWSDLANSTPEANIETAKQQVLTASGMPANMIHIPWYVASYLKRHPAIREVVKHSAGKYDAFDGGPLNGLPPVLWELNVMVSRATYNSANPGQTQSNAFIWADDVWIGYVNQVPNPLEQSFGYTFEHQPLQITRGELGYLSHSEAIEATEDCLAKVIASACGYLIIDCIA